MSDGAGAEAGGARTVWTVPNAITLLRFVGIAPLLAAAATGARPAFLIVLGLLLLSDWADGKLAVWLDQRTELGARLDSAVDAAMYGSIALSCWWLETEAMREHLAWFALAIGTWGVSGIVSVARFGRMPGYHTWAAKLSWLVVAGTVLTWIGAGDARAVPWALGLATVTNLEAVAIGFTLPNWRADVPSILEAVRLRRRHGAARAAEDSAPPPPPPDA